MSCRVKISRTILSVMFLFSLDSVSLVSTASTRNFLHPTNYTDLEALHSIKNHIGGDFSGFLASWNHSLHFCHWRGVTCSARHQRVIKLNLYGKGLWGTLSPYVGNLTFLKYLDLGENNFTGVIPQEIGRLYRSQNLSLYDNNFQGRYSSVYKGILKYSEQKVAVKVLHLQQQGARKGFEAECEALRNTRHRNIVKVITSCSGTDSKGNEFKALVYEFMPNGSLESWIHPSSTNLQQQKNLNLIHRLNIAIDVASAVDYLHHCCEIRIIHRDIKPSNILLDHKLSAHLGDFGSARSLLLPIEKSTQLRIRSSAIGIIGTVGYVALECGMGGPVSTLADVYSYGILLLEMFSGKSPTDNMFIDDFSLHNYVNMNIPNQVLSIADPRLLPERGNESLGAAVKSRKCFSLKIERCLASIFHIGIMCSYPIPRDRIDIADALMELKAIRDVFLRVDETEN